MSTGIGPQRPQLHATGLTGRLLRGTAIGLLAGLLVAGGAAGTPGAARAATAESQEFLDDALERLEAGDGDAALIQLRNALQADPENWEARRLLGQLYLGAGHFDAAEKELQRLLEAKPDDPETALLLARARFGQGNHEAALAALPEGLSDGELLYQAQVLRAEAYLALERVEEAAEVVADLRGRRLTDARVSVLAARTALARKQPEEAASFAREATETDPESSVAWLMRAQVALAQRRDAEAAEFARRAGELAPGSISARLLLAEIDLRAGRLDEAEATLDQVLELAPKAVEPRYLKAALLAAQKDYRGAERLLDELSEPLRDYRPAQFLTAMVKYQVGRYAQARTLIEGYLAEEPGNRAARRLLAATLLRSDNPARAAEVLTRAAGQAPRDAGTLRLLATAQMRAGDFSAATETLRALANATKGRASADARSLANVLEVEPEDLQVEGQQLAQQVSLILNDLQLGELEAALKGGQALVEAYPDNPVAHNTLAGVHLMRGENDQARAELERALELDDGFRAAYDNLDRLDARAGDFEAIEQRRKAFLERHPNDPLGVLHYAAFLSERDRVAEARELIEQALDAQPDSRELLVGSINLAMRAGDREAAETQVTRLVTRRPDDAQAHLKAGQALLQLENHEQAAERFERAHELAGGASMLPLELLVQARIRAQDLEGAEQAARELVEALPDNFLANRLLVDILLSAGKDEEVQQVAARAGEADPELQARLRAHAALRRGRAGEAADILEEVAEPSVATVEQRFAARSQSGDPQRAQELLEAWVAEHPGEAGPSLLLANRLVERQDYEEAEAVLTAALESGAENATLLNNLAWLRSMTGGAGAVELARRALGLAPDSPEIADTLGWLLVQRGDLAEGEALLRQAASRAPDDPSVAYHLAYALAKNGEQEDAIAILEQIAEDEAVFADAEDARALLGELQGKARN